MRKWISIFLAILMLAMPGLAEATSLEGTWNLTSAQTQGITIDDISMLGVSMSISLDADGTALMVLNEMEESGSWAQNGSVLEITDSFGEVQEFAILEDGTLSMEQDGVVLILTREDSASGSSQADAGAIAPSASGSSEADAGAVAPSAAGETITSANGYSMTLPEGWFLFDQEMYQQLLDLYGENFMEAAGITLELFESLDFSQQEIYYSADMMSNMNVSPSPASGLTTEILPMLEDTFREMFIAAGFADYSVDGLVDFSGNQFCAWTLTMQNGISARQYIIIADDTMFTFSMSGVSDADIALMLGSFSVA